MKGPAINDFSDTTRRGALTLGLGAATALSVPVAATPATPSVEGQRVADLGNGLYRNPVLSGDRGLMDE